MFHYYIVLWKAYCRQDTTSLIWIHMLAGLGVSCRVVCPGSSHHHLFGDYVSSFSSLAATTVSFWGNDCVSSSSVFLYQVMFYNVVDYYYYLPSRGRSWAKWEREREKKKKRMSTTTTTSIVLNLAVTCCLVYPPVAECSYVGESDMNYRHSNTIATQGL